MLELFPEEESRGPDWRRSSLESSLYTGQERSRSHSPGDRGGTPHLLGQDCSLAGSKGHTSSRSRETPPYSGHSQCRLARHRSDRSCDKDSRPQPGGSDLSCTSADTLLLTGLCPRHTSHTHHQDRGHSGGDTPHTGRPPAWSPAHISPYTALSPGPGGGQEDTSSTGGGRSRNTPHRRSGRAGRRRRGGRRSSQEDRRQHSHPSCLSQTCSQCQVQLDVPEYH